MSQATPNRPSRRTAEPKFFWSNRCALSVPGRPEGPFRGPPMAGGLRLRLCVYRVLQRAAPDRRAEYSDGVYSVGTAKLHHRDFRMWRRRRRGGGCGVGCVWVGAEDNPPPRSSTHADMLWRPAARLGGGCMWCPSREVPMPMPIVRTNRDGEVTAAQKRIWEVYLDRRHRYDVLRFAGSGGRQGGASEARSRGESPTEKAACEGDLIVLLFLSNRALRGGLTLRPNFVAGKRQIPARLDHTHTNASTKAPLHHHVPQ